MLISLSLLLLWFVFSPQKWKHDQVGWGYPDPDIHISASDLPGAYGEAVCKFCQKNIIKDRGGWYHPNFD